jgi:hypothetical protein
LAAAEQVGERLGSAGGADDRSDVGHVAQAVEDLVGVAGALGLAGGVVGPGGGDVGGTGSGRDAGVYPVAELLDGLLGHRVGDALAWVLPGKRDVLV